MESRIASPPAVPALGSLEGLRPEDVRRRQSAPGAAPEAARKLDLRGMEPPAKLSEVRLEDLTIDGICGVY